MSTILRNKGFSRYLPICLAACFAFWTTQGFAEEDADRLERLQAQEEILAELESAHGSLNPSLVRPLRNMIEMLRELSEFERAAELQQRLLKVMETNASRQTPDWIPMLKDMVVDQVNSEETGGVSDLLQQLRTLTAARNDPVALVQTVELQAHWLLTGGAGTTHRERVDNFFEARDLLQHDYAYLIRELFDESDPENIHRMYRIALIHNQTANLLLSDYGIGSRAEHKLESFDGVSRLSKTSTSYSLGWVRAIYDALSATGDLEAQAMAKIYEGDFYVTYVTRPQDYSTTPIEKYMEGRELLREAGVSEERIALFFNRPQVVPVRRFHATLEEAIAQQEADLAAWRPEREGAIHAPLFRAWNGSAPRLMEPVSDHVFWDQPAKYFNVDMEFNINGFGRSISPVRVLSASTTDREIQNRVRRAVQGMRFRPILENNRGQRLRDVQMRVLIPRTEG